MYLVYWCTWCTWEYIVYLGAPGSNSGTQDLKLPLRDHLTINVIFQHSVLLLLLLLLLLDNLKKDFLVLVIPFLMAKVFLLSITPVAPARTPFLRSKHYWGQGRGKILGLFSKTYGEKYKI